MQISPAERQAAAASVGLHPQYLYQCLMGLKAMDPKTAVRLEKATGNRIRRWHVRPRDWHEVWPELQGAEGAPDKPAQHGNWAAQPAMEGANHAG